MEDSGDWERTCKTQEVCEEEVRNQQKFHFQGMKFSRNKIIILTQILKSKKGVELQQLALQLSSGNQLGCKCSSLLYSYLVEIYFNEL